MKNIIDVWEPKYVTNQVLVAKHKVKKGDNYIRFTKAKHLQDGLYKIHSDVITKCRFQPNGKGFVYLVPFGELSHESDNAPLF